MSVVTVVFIEADPCHPSAASPLMAAQPTGKGAVVVVGAICSQ